MSNEKKYPHYFKPCPFDQVDVYRVCTMFGVTDQGVGHAIKKLLCLGERGVKDQIVDTTEARDTLNRVLEMLEEDRELENPAEVASESNIRAERAATQGGPGPTQEFVEGPHGNLIEVTPSPYMSNPAPSGKTEKFDDELVSQAVKTVAESVTGDGLIDMPDDYTE